jgi:uncharacterized protein YjbJ (UPF0337 family)
VPWTYLKAEIVDGELRDGLRRAGLKAAVVESPMDGRDHYLGTGAARRSSWGRTSAASPIISPARPASQLGFVSPPDEVGRTALCPCAGRPPLGEPSAAVAEEESVVSERSDELKGRAKEAAGAVTGDKKLKREGKSDQAAGKAKRFVDDLGDKAAEGIDAIKQRANKRR